MNSRKHLPKDPPGENPGPQLSQEHGPASPSPSPAEAWGQPKAQSGNQQALETQDWVCEPPESRRSSRHWSLSIEERRQRAVQDAAGASAHFPGLLQVVAQLASEDVDKDVLLSHPPRPAEATRALPAGSAPSGRAMTSEAQDSRWPPS